MKRWLYVPVEIKFRELQGKLFLACVAAKNGFDVILGSKSEINSKSAVFPPGTVFNVGLGKNLGKMAAKFKKEGHVVASIDEEGLVTLREELYLRHRVAAATIRLTDIFFCWGERHESIIRKKALGSKCKLFSSGNPRFDMLRPEYRRIFNEEVNAIKNEFGKYILINSTFSFGNNFIGDSFLIESLRKKGMMDSKEDERYFLDFIEWQKKVLKEFKKIIPILSREFPEHSIIIRPHPSEKKELWEDMQKDSKNVFAVYRGNVIPWIMGADAMVHNGCTTAVEAFLLGKKAVAYRPLIVKDMEAELPNLVSLETYEPQGLVAGIRDAINGKQPNDNEKIRKEMTRYISGVDGKTASEIIVEKLGANVEKRSGDLNKIKIAVFDIWSKMKISIGNLLLNDSGANYISHKTPGIGEQEIIETIKKLDGGRGNFSNLAVEHVKGTCYHIYESK